MKTTFLTLSLLAVGLVAQAQTTKPKTTSTAKTTSATKPATASAPASTKATTTNTRPTSVAKPATTATATKPASATSTTRPAGTAASSTPTTTQSTGTRPATTNPTTAPASSATRTTTNTRPAATPVLKNTYDGTGFSVGLRAGGNVILNNLQEDLDLGAGSSGQSAKKVPGFTAGLILNYGFSSAFSIQPEILYTRRSIKSGGTFGGQTLAIQADINSIEVPLLFKFSFGDRTRFFVNAGPYVNYGLDSQIKLTLMGETTTDKRKFDGSDGRLEYGATGGIGAALPLGPGSLLIEGRFSYGLGDNTKNRTMDYVSPKIATASVGYIIPLGR